VRATLKGRVSTEEGPAQGAKVYLCLPGGKEVHTITDENGGYRFNVGSRGRVSVRVEMPEYLGETRPVWIGESGEYSLGLSLYLEGRIIVELVDAESGSPVPDAEVVLMSRLAKLVLREFEPSGMAGIFTCEQTGSGWYVLRATAEGYVDHHQLVRFNTREMKLKVPLTNAARISGTVLDRNGRAIAGAKIMAGLTGKETVAEIPDVQVLTGTDGTFVLEKLRPGETYVYACKEGYAPAAIEGVMLKPGEWLAGVAVTLYTGAAARGAVVDDARNPVGNAKVTFWALYFHSLHPRYVCEAMTDSDGKFEIAPLPDADYNVEISHPEYQSLQLHNSTRVQNGRDVEGLIFRLYKGAGITGRVLDAFGEPIGGVRVVVSRELQNGLMEEITSVLADKDGYFRISSLEEGEYSLDFRAAEHAHKKLQKVPAPSENVYVTLDRHLSLSGSVLIDGMPGARLKVLLRKGTVNIRKTTDGDGGFRFSHIAPGKYLLQVMKNRRVIDEREIELKDCDADILIEK
jgi:protocatechuate 3,4-dioxygenase beta subunit